MVRIASRRVPSTHREWPRGARPRECAGVLRPNHPDARLALDPCNAYWLSPWRVYRR